MTTHHENYTNNQLVVMLYDRTDFPSADAKYRALGLFANFPVGTPKGVPKTTALNPNDWQIRLPLEWEWQWAAQNGDEARKYPWGDWKPGFANTNEAGFGQ